MDTKNRTHTITWHSSDFLGGHICAGRSQAATEASEADWEGRLKSAVDSAEQWNAFADKLTAERAEVDAELATTRADVQARLGDGRVGVRVFQAEVTAEGAEVDAELAAARADVQSRLGYACIHRHGVFLELPLLASWPLRARASMQLCAAHAGVAEDTHT